MRFTRWCRGPVFSIAILSIVLAGAFAEDSESEKQVITLRSIETDAGPMIEARVGGLVFTARHLQFQHKSSPATHVYPIEGQIVMKQGDNRTAAKEMTASLRLGPLRFDR